MDKEEFKRSVEAKVKALELEIAQLKEATSPISPDDAIGRVSRMDAINNKSVSEASLRNAQSKLAGLQNVLRDLDKPDFGICPRCKQPIPEARILLMPEKKFCVRCSQ